MKLGLDIVGNVLDGRSNGVPGSEWRVYNNIKTFNLEISLVQGFKGTSIIKVMVKRYGKVKVYDGSDKGQVFSGTGTSRGSDNRWGC